MSKNVSPLKSLLSGCVNIFLLIFFSVNGQDAISFKDKFAFTKQTYTYKIVDNHEIKADVYRYPSDEILPAIIWIHGGGLIVGSRNWLSYEPVELYLKAGYTIISIDYRLAPETKLEAIIEDIEDAYIWVRLQGPDLFKIDPDRIAVVGHSAGGYLTLMAGFHLKPHPKALVSFYGYGEITGSWYTKPDSLYSQSPTVSKVQAYKAVGDSIISDTPTESLSNGRDPFYIYCRQQGLWPQEVTGHDPEKERGWFSEYEPLRNVTATYPPTMLLHGEADTEVPFEQAVLMAEAFKRHNVAYEFLTTQDWRHGFERAGMEDASVKKAFDRVLAFLYKYIQ